MIKGSQIIEAFVVSFKKFLTNDVSFKKTLYFGPKTLKRKIIFKIAFLKDEKRGCVFKTNVALLRNCKEFILISDTVFQGLGVTLLSSLDPIQKNFMTANVTKKVSSIVTKMATTK